MPDFFTFQGEQYTYFKHLYGETWENERAVEIPIVRTFMWKHRGKRILEIGNVLSHYFTIDHDIVDKYEEVEGIINQDVVNFKPQQKYDLIISISTLEHVGFDEDVREPEKIIRAVENLKRCLVLGGKIFVTLPLGYNKDMDRLLEEKKIVFSDMYCLKKISADNKWKEVDYKDIKGSRYNYPFRFANGLIIGII